MSTRVHLVLRVPHAFSCYLPIPFLSHTLFRTEDDPLPSVARALQRCRVHCTMLLKSGTYPAINVSRAPAGLTIAAAPGATVRIVTSDRMAAVLLTGCDRITIRGLQIEGRVGIEIAQCTAVTLENNKIIVSDVPYVKVCVRCGGG